MKTDEELKKIATDLYDGHIFCDRSVENESDLGMVFMPLLLGAFSDMPKEEKENIGMLYEYHSEAGPRSCNGHPCFYSVKYLTREETKKMFEFFDQYKKFKEEFLAKPEEKCTT